MADQSVNYDMMFGGLSSGISVIHADADLTIEYANPAFYQMLGYTQEDIRRYYAGHLSAMLTMETNQKLQDLILGRHAKVKISMEHTIKGMCSESWYLSEASYHTRDGGGYIYLVSQNIDRYKAIEYTLSSIQKQDAYLFDNAEYDFVEYDWKTGLCRGVKSKWFALGQLRKGDKILECLIEDNLIHPEDQKRFLDSISGITREDTRILMELKVKAPNGQYKWARLSVGCLKYGRRVSGVCIFNDISAEKEATLKYLEETFFYQSVLSDQDAFAHVDVTEDRLLRVGGMWGFLSELMDTAPFGQLFLEYKSKVVHPEDRINYAEIISCENLTNSLSNGITHLGCEFRRIMEQNKMVWMGMTIHLFSNPLNQHVMALIYTKNIDEQKRQRLALERESGRDILTQVFNRESAKYHIKEYMEVMNGKEFCGLLLFDIGDIKTVQDTLGHRINDELLVKICCLLKRAFRKRDILGRFDKDEFIVFLKDVDSLANLKKRLQGLLYYIAHELKPEITGNIGIYMVRKEDTYEDSLHRAKEALIAAKKLGESRYVFYQDLMDGAIAKQETVVPGEIDMLWAPTASLEELYGEESINNLVGEYGDIAYLVDPRTYELLCGNDAFYNRIGKSERECAGMKCYELMHGRTSPCPFCRSANWNTNKFYMYRNYNEILEQEFLIKNKLVSWNHAQVLLALAVDLSNDKHLDVSIDNNAMENGYLLSGIQHMQEAENLDRVMYNAMEAIGGFFRAERVRFWRCTEDENDYKCIYFWNLAADSAGASDSLDQVDSTMVGLWLYGRKWNETFYAESQEVMLCNSYDMHEWMKRQNVVNQTWTMLKDGDASLGFFEIDNMRSNLQNDTFLKTFCGFIESEWHKRVLLEDIIYINYHDNLTGALNRSSYECFTYKYHADNVNSIAAVVVNINGLKIINTKLGIEGGNECLKVLADIMALVFGKAQVFRLNGDEFLAILSNTSQNYVEERIKAMEEMIQNANRFTVSYGYTWDDIEKNLDNAVEFATHSMHLNKKGSHNKEQMAQGGRDGILADILNIIDARRMEVYLQPKVDIRLKQVVGAEALVRMHHNEYGVMPPSKFIDVLEKNNLIRYVDLFVFEETCKTMERWIKEGKECPRVSVNFSRITLMERDLIQTIDQIFSQYEVPKERIEIEITESFEEGGKALLNQAAQKLSEAGYAISLDDFGTKYTNLSILSDIEVNILKIDKSLVYSLVENQKNQVILKNIIEMCNELGIEVIAEGVETQDQEDMLRQLGCYLIQGYLYSKPISIIDFEEKFM